MGDIDACAVCGKKQSAALNLAQEVFKINTATSCGHKFCEMCLENSFSRKRQFSCPICKTIVTREKLSKKSLDETEVERDYRIRRRVKSIFNKPEEQFSTLLEFNNYEEMAEDIIFNLVNGIDEVAMENMIKAYESENLKSITEIQSKKADKNRLEEDLIRAEEGKRVQRIQENQGNLDKEKRDRIEHSRQMNQLLLGERDEITVKLPKSSTLTEAVSASTSTSTAVPGTVVNAAPPHPLFVLLAQRPDPLPISAIATSSSRLSSQAITHSVAAHAAGGYDHSNYTRRNWSEIVSAVEILTESSSTKSNSISDITALLRKRRRTTVDNNNTCWYENSLDESAMSHVTRMWPIYWD